MAAQQPEAPADGELPAELEELRDLLVDAAGEPEKSWGGTGLAEILARFFAVWPDLLARLRAERGAGREPAVGELPAGWEEAEKKLYDHLIERDFSEEGIEEVLVVVERLWPAPPPPAAWEAIVAAVERELPCGSPGGLSPCLKPATGESHSADCPARHRYVVLQALRSVELASAARAQRLHDGIEAAIPRLQERDGDGAYDALDAALDDAPPSDPWSALMALLAELESEEVDAREGMDMVLADPDYYGKDYVRRARAGHTRAARAVRRLRAALGLPPKEPGSG